MNADKHSFRSIGVYPRSSAANSARPQSCHRLARPTKRSACMIYFIYDLHHEHHDRNRFQEKPAELRRQHPDLPDLRISG
jgi:hypothetical protein